jgi:hypothetical protein
VKRQVLRHAYLSKPIEPNALFDVVDRQLLVSGARRWTQADETS